MKLLVILLWMFSLSCIAEDTARKFDVKDSIDCRNWVKFNCISIVVEADKSNGALTFKEAKLLLEHPIGGSSMINPQYVVTSSGRIKTEVCVSTLLLKESFLFLYYSSKTGGFDTHLVKGAKYADQIDIGAVKENGACPIHVPEDA